MAAIPSVELLNATHDFPGKYVFKAIGSTETDFHTKVLAEVCLVLSLSADPPHSTRTTPDGRHLALTLEVKVATAEVVVKLYERILTVPGLHLLL